MGAEVTALLSPLTRPELDQLMLTAEQAEHRARHRLQTCPCTPEALADAAGVAQDAQSLAMACYDESLERMLAGEVPGG